MEINYIKLINDNIEKFNKIEDYLNKNKNIALYGAGLYGQFCADFLEKQGYNVKLFIDNNKNKIGDKIKNIPITNINSDLLTDCDVIFVTARHCINEIINTYTGNKNIISFDFWYVIKNQDKFKHIIDNVLTDNTSKHILDQILCAKLTGEESYFANIKDLREQYFCLPEFVQNQNEIFVDAGAYTGDTIERFIWSHAGCFNQIYAFEPGKEAYKALNYRKKHIIKDWAKHKSDIITHQCALGETDSYLYFSLNNNLKQGLFVSPFLSKGERITVKNLDKYNICPTFIKADIEGMELNFLKGAKETITNCKPKIAICAYHRPEDIIEIINYCLSLIPDYKVSIRHHSFQAEETVIYFY